MLATILIGPNVLAELCRNCET